MRQGRGRQHQTKFGILPVSPLGSSWHQATFTASTLEAVLSSSLHITGVKSPTPSQAVMVPLQGSLSPGTPCTHQVVIQSGAKKAWAGGGGWGGLLLAQKV